MSTTVAVDTAPLSPDDHAVASVSAIAGRFVVGADHHPEGGLGSAVADALLACGPRSLCIVHLIVQEQPGP